PVKAMNRGEVDVRVSGPTETPEIGAAPREWRREPLGHYSSATEEEAESLMARGLIQTSARQGARNGTPGRALYQQEDVWLVLFNERQDEGVERLPLHVPHQEAGHVLPPGMRRGGTPAPPLSASRRQVTSSAPPVRRRGVRWGRGRTSSSRSPARPGGRT